MPNGNGTVTKWALGVASGLSLLLAGSVLTEFSSHADEEVLEHHMKKDEIIHERMEKACHDRHEDVAKSVTEIEKAVSNIDAKLEILLDGYGGH